MTKHFWLEVAKDALRVFGYLVAFGFIGFLFVPALVNAGAGLRIPAIGLLVLAAGAVMFMDGAARGEKDAAMSEKLQRLEKKKEYQPSEAEKARRFNRFRGAIGPMLGALPLFAVALYVAFTAQPFVYQLQDLPAWLEPYMRRPEIGDALAYMRSEPLTPPLTDYLRVATRFMLFPYVGLAGAMTDEASLLFDRVAPLLSLVMPALVAIGYQFGPARRARAVKVIEEAKRTPRKRLKKDRRQGGSKEKKQLV